MDQSLNRFVDKIVSRIKERPVTSIVATNVVTAVVCGLAYAKASGLSLSAVAQLGALAVIKAVPGGKGVLEAEKKKMTDSMEEELLSETAHEEAFPVLPDAGRSAQELDTLLTRYADFDAKKSNGKISGAIYYGEGLNEVIANAYKKFALSNPLHPDVFPMVRKMEAEVISMVVDLFHGGPDACGCVTSGGTESILMAMKAYRDKAFAEKGITAPELVAPTTAHAAFDKAAHYFNIRIVKVKPDPETMMVKAVDIKAAMTKNTVAVVGSAPQFPNGVIDPIEEIAAIALEAGVPMHVDCCLGSFAIAFAADVGFPTKKFDFSVPGVTSISCDTHKYGFAPKGTSVIMYASGALRKHQFFVASDWPGGIYASPAIAGSRPGALVASAWATMMHLGKDGYRKAFTAIFNAVKTIKEAIRAHPKVKLVGEPEVTVVAFDTDHSDLNIYFLADALKAKGWNLNILQFPSSAHLCVTYANAGMADTFVADLDAAVKHVEDNLQEYKSNKDGAAAIYGLSTTLADRSMVVDLAQAFIETCYKTNTPKA